MLFYVGKRSLAISLKKSFLFKRLVVEGSRHFCGSVTRSLAIFGNSVTLNNSFSSICCFLLLCLKNCMIHLLLRARLMIIEFVKYLFWLCYGVRF